MAGRGGFGACREGGRWAPRRRIDACDTGRGAAASATQPSANAVCAGLAHDVTPQPRLHQAHAPQGAPHALAARRRSEGRLHAQRGAGAAPAEGGGAEEAVHSLRQRGAHLFLLAPVLGQSLARAGTGGDTRMRQLGRDRRSCQAKGARSARESPPRPVGQTDSRSADPSLARGQPPAQPAPHGPTGSGGTGRRPGTAPASRWPPRAAPCRRGAASGRARPPAWPWPPSAAPRGREQRASWPR